MGVFTWRRGSSLRFPLMALYSFTWYHHKCHAGANRPGVSSPRLSHRGENFTPVGDFATVSCKREKSIRSGGESVCRRLERVAHAQCLRFWITCVFYQHEVYLQITRYEMTQSSCIRDTKSKSHLGMKLAPVRVFSCKRPLTSKLEALDRTLLSGTIGWILTKFVYFTSLSGPHVVQKENSLKKFTEAISPV